MPSAAAQRGYRHWTVIGVGAVVLAALVNLASGESAIGLRELAISLFLFITAPVTAHLLAKAAINERRGPPTA